MQVDISWRLKFTAFRRWHKARFKAQVVNYCAPSAAWRTQPCAPARPKALTSIPSIRPSPSSKRCCEKPQNGPRLAYGTWSASSSISSSPTTVPITSASVTTIQIDRRPLYFSAGAGQLPSLIGAVFGGNAEISIESMAK